MNKITIWPQVGTFRENIMNTQLHITRCQFWPLGNLWVGRKERNWFWRLYYNESDGAGIIYNEKRIELTADKFCLIPPGVPFETWQKNELRQFYVHFDTLLMRNQVRDDVYLFNITEQLRDMMYQIDREFKNETVQLPAKIQTLSLAICGIALSQIPDKDIVTSEIPKEIRYIMSQIRRNVSRDISIDQLAAEISLSQNSLIRLFKKHIGITPYQFLTDLRMERASQLLSDSDIPIEEIAINAGYKDRFHFSRLFKKKTGRSPGVYRKENRRQS